MNIFSLDCSRGEILPTFLTTRKGAFESKHQRRQKSMNAPYSNSRSMTLRKDGRLWFLNLKNEEWQTKDFRICFLWGNASSIAPTQKNSPWAPRLEILGPPQNPVRMRVCWNGRLRPYPAFGPQCPEINNLTRPLITHSEGWFVSMRLPISNGPGIEPLSATPCTTLQAVH